MLCTNSTGDGFRTSTLKFAAAVKYAQEINNDPVKKAAYPVRRGKSVFNTAVSDYMARE